MTALPLDRAETWTAPPGWGIRANLTPPELLNGRRLRGIRRLLVAALMAIAVLIAAGYGLARWQSSQAAGAVAAQAVLTSQLEGQVLRYAPVTEIEGSVAAVRAQLAVLMSGDVDFATLVDSISAATPPGVSITSEQITISGAGAAAAAAGSGTSLDTSGIPQIGTITLAGTAPGLPGFAAYVLSLQTVSGIAEVVPGSTAITGGLVTFSVTMSVTDRVLSNHYAITPTTPTPTASRTPR